MNEPLMSLDTDADGTRRSFAEACRSSPADSPREPPVRARQASIWLHATVFRRLFPARS